MAHNRKQFAGFSLAIAIALGVSGVFTWRGFSSRVPVAKSNLHTGSAWEPVLAISATIDAGVVSSNDLVGVIFNLVNHSDKPVSLVSIATSCGCTRVANFITGVQTMAPGESVKLPVKVSTRGFPPGRFLKQVVCRFNYAGGDESLLLSATGTVDASIAFVVFPGVLDFGIVHVGETVERTLYFRAASHLLDALPYKIKLDTAGNTLSFRSPALLGDEVTVKSVTVSLSPHVDDAGQYISALLSLKINGSVPHAATVQYRATVIAEKRRSNG